MWSVKSEKSKPVEKRGRKAKGLKLQSAVTIARLPTMCPKGYEIIARKFECLYRRGEKMTLKFKNTRTILNTAIFLTIFVSFFFNPISALAMAGSTSNFTEFSQSVKNGQADVLTGVYVSDVMALPVVQQPYGNAGYVSNNDGEVTQFRMASQFGNVGILAHNHLSGSSFSQLAVGQEVRLVNGDGSVEYFVIAEILRYHALQPNSPYSSFRNLDKDETLSAEQMFKRVYFGDHHVTFQTCIEAEGNASWGRLFVIAIPKSEYAGFNHLDHQLVQ